MSRPTVHVPTGIQLLLVEDNPVSAQAVTEILAEGRPRFAVRQADCLAAALERLGDGNVEVVLLDLGLPDSSGIRTLERVRAAAPELPIVVLTGVEYEEMALAALGQGADDYLFKGEFDRGLLVRSVRYSMERRQILNDLEQTHHRRSLRRELGTLSGLARRLEERRDETTPTLRDRDRDRFDRLAGRYADLVVRGEEEGHFEVPDLASELCEADGGAQDVLELHVEALRRVADLVEPRETEERIEAGRVLVVELLAQLAASWMSRHDG